MIEKKRGELNNKQLIPSDSEQTLNEIQQPESTWLEQLEAYLTDEFHYQLNETLNTLWNEVLFGAWDNKITFFKNLDEQLEVIYRLKNSPEFLRTHFEHINPSLQPYPQGGFYERLPFLRQQVFLINALHIIIKKRYENDPGLLIALRVLEKLLHRKIVETLFHLGTRMSNPEWEYLANRVERRGTIRDKAYEVVLFLSEAIKKNNIKSPSDTRDTLLFMKEQLSIPYEVIIRNNNKIITEFGDNWKLESFCACLYYEYYRLIQLADLENSHQNDSTEALEKTEVILTLENDFDKNAMNLQQAESQNRYPPYYLEQIIETAVRLCKEKVKVRAIDIYTDLGIEKKTYHTRIKAFGYNTGKVLYEAQERVRESESSK